MKPRLAVYVLLAVMLSTTLIGCSRSVYSSGRAAPLSQERSPMAYKVRMLKQNRGQRNP